MSDKLEFNVGDRIRFSMSSPGVGGEGEGTVYTIKDNIVSVRTMGLIQYMQRDDIAEVLEKATHAKKQ